MNFTDIKSIYDQYVLNTYNRFPISFVRGDGVRLYDSEGKEYIDFAAGIGVNSVGYASPVWAEAVAAQARTLAHVSNLYYTEPGGLLAQKLCELSGLNGVFFSNSGAEANEGMIKCARKYSADKYGSGRHTIVTLRDSFHGRTVTTLAATGQDVFHQHFHPFTEGFRHVLRGDLDALRAQPEDVCAVMLEVVQGEGGIWPLETAYLQAVQALCAERDWLLLIDEVQTGLGRTGAWFAFQAAGLKPDLVSFAKGVAGGLPLGGFLAGEKTCRVLQPHDHAATFGANPVCCAAALATLEILAPVLPEVAKRGQMIRDAVAAMNLPVVKGIRGVGLMIGIVVDAPPRDIIGKLLENGLVCLTAGKDVVRLLPPLTVSEADCKQALGILETTLCAFG